MAKEKEYQCYSCEKQISKEEANIVREFYDKIMNEAAIEFTEKLAENYVHCVGEDKKFFEDGAIVLCAKCVAENIIKATE